MVEGLEWLLEKDKWPRDAIRGNAEKDEIAVLFQKENKVENVNQESWCNWERFNRFSKYIRTLSWIMLLVSNYRKLETEHKFHIIISMEEYGEAEIKLLETLKAKILEGMSTLKEVGKKKSKPNLVSQLDLILDHNLIKCKGR